MNINKQVRKFIQNTGFSSIPRNEGSRLINKNGSININRTGLKFSEWFDVFHWLINMSWPAFLGILLVGFIVANSIFAFVYVSLGMEGLSGIHSDIWINQFLEAFYFSAQTLTTLGYGAISPISIGHNIVSSFEAFVGLLSFATSTGLLYGRFSRPSAKLLFSNKALISPYLDHKRGFMFRLVNSKEDLLIHLKVSVIMSWLDTENNARKFQKLPLEISDIEMLVSSWTIVHPINEESPLYDLSNEDLKKQDVEIYVQIGAFDETYAQQIHARTSYKFEEIVWGAKFQTILGHNDNGQSTLDLNKFHNYNLVTLPKIEKGE